MMKYNLKNPGVKRILKEAKELANHKTYDYSAQPLEDNIFEWHFTVRGPKDTEFEDGRYHGRILLPNEYPFKPPEIIFLTPNGRFELHTKVCLSITGFHPEYWQPAWGIRTVLLAIIGFFPTEAKGAIGSLQYDKALRKKLAKSSINWVCSTCGEHMKEALSSELDEAAEKNDGEEIPRFEITYKAEDNSTATDCGSGSTVSKASVNSIADTASKSNDEKDKSYKGSRRRYQDAEEGSQVEKSLSNDLKRNRIGSCQPINNDNANATSSTNGVCGDRRPPSTRSPIWLDALIVLLVSVIVALLVHKNFT